MPLVVPADGAKLLLEIMNGLPPFTPFVDLFVNNYNPVYASHLADFTQASFPGYVPGQSVFFPLVLPDGSGGAMQSSIPVAWTQTGSGAPQTAYGYYIWQNDGGGSPTILWAERMTPSVTFGPGITLTATLVFDGISAFG